MKIPKTIKIGGIDYKVLYPKNKKEMKGKIGDYYSDGKVDIEKQWIKFKFNKGAGKEYKEMVFFHELTHLLFYYTGTGDWDNEREVHSFASTLYQALKDNQLIK